MKVQQRWCSNMIYMIIFILGCCIGSFVNVIFSRTDWYKGRSRCDECGYMLKWYDLIPVISFLILKGKCRKCKTKINDSHIVSELMMGAAFLVSSFCFENYGLFYGLLASVALFSISVAAIEDYKEQMVYTFVLVGAIVLVTFVKCGYYIYKGFYIYAVGTLVSVVILKVITTLIALKLGDKIGAGDFDILIVIFIIGGFKGLLFSVTVASVIGCGIYLPAIILKKRDKKEPLPFIPLLLMGTMYFLMI